MVFKNRVEAGNLLAELLGDVMPDRDNAVVLGIPRGGVIVAAVIARKLRLPLGVVVTNKIPAPGNPEYAIGAVAPDGVVTPNLNSGFTVEEVESLAASVRAKVQARREKYNVSGDAEINPQGKDIVLVDDGIATGLTAFAAIDYLKRKGARSIFVAVPVIAADAAHVIRARDCRLVTLAEPPVFYSVSQFYQSFDQVSDEEVQEVLATGSLGNEGAAGMWAGAD